jgi:diguanylate cyclase (GGDEF)-like protein
MKDQQLRIYAEQVRIIYSQTPTAVIGGVISGSLFAWIFKGIVDNTTLIIWLLTLLTVLLVRTPSYFLFKRKNPSEEEIAPWGTAFLIMTVIHGSVWGAASWLFMSHEQPVYLVIVALWMVGMSAAAISAYSAYYRAMLAFFLPVMLPAIAHLFLIHEGLGTPLGLALILYIVVVLRAAIPINTAIVDSIRLNFELEKEIEVRKKAEEKLRELAQQDGLTGLANRRHFDSVLEREVLCAERERYPLSLIMIDIDYFKAFNDTYGHQAGDECLRQVSNAVQKTLKRPADLAARYGGEELAVILPYTDQEEVDIMAKKIRDAIIACAIPHSDSQIEEVDYVTISAGVATFAKDDRGTSEGIISIADGRLYQAKEKGRNRVVSR